MKSLSTALTLLLIALSSIAIMPQYSDSHLAQTSEIIVIGRIVVEEPTCFIQGRNTCTPWRVEVEEFLKGTGGESLVFYTQGGQIPNSSRRLWVEDQPEPIIGERAVIFLEELSGNWFVNGLFQGYRRISEGAVDGIALPDFAEYIIHLAHGVDFAKPRPRPSAEASPMSISSITPTTGLAGDGTITLTISGLGFGLSTGTVEFTYYQWPGYPPNFLHPSWTTIHYWSDTEIRTDIAANASSGPIRVTPAVGTAQVSPMDFTVTFGYKGNRWPAATPVYVTLNYNPSTYPSTGCGPAIQAALNTWSTAGAWWRYTYGSPTSDGDTLFDAGSNGNNSIHFGYFPDSSPPLGICQIYLDGWPVMYIHEMDIRFNLAEPWSAGDPVSANDVESIALHEAGHGLQLMDVYGIADIDKIMYGVSTTGTAKRTLHTTDNAGIIYIYGNDATQIDEPSESGEFAQVSVTQSPSFGHGNIELNLPVGADVRVEIIDITGRSVAEPFEGNLDAGLSRIPYEIPSAKPSGVYFAVVRTGGEFYSKKIVVLK